MMIPMNVRELEYPVKKADIDPSYSIGEFAEVH